MRKQVEQSIADLHNFLFDNDFLTVIVLTVFIVAVVGAIYYRYFEGRK